MFDRLGVFSLCVLGAVSGCAQAEPPQTGEMIPVAQIPDIPFTSITGEAFALSDYSGQVVLVVNTASKCGYTSQYEGLQAVWTDMKDEGLVIIGIPSGDFGGQEFESEAEVKKFCELNFGVDFPLTETSKVTGPDRIAFYSYAEDVLGQVAVPKWNFHKVLVGKDGVPVKAYKSAIKPQDDELLSDIRDLL